MSTTPNRFAESKPTFRIKDKRTIVPPEQDPPWSRWQGYTNVHNTISNPLTVYVQPATFDKICAHAEADRDLERFGLLVGRIGRTPNTNEYWVEVTDMVPATWTSSSRTHVEVPAEELIRLDRQINEQSLGRDVRKIGWYHTHPGFGIFFSSTDKTNQDLCYNADWQIGMVVDPQRREYGFFSGKYSSPVGNVMPSLAPSVASRVPTVIEQIPDRNPGIANPDLLPTGPRTWSSSRLSWATVGASVLAVASMVVIGFYTLRPDQYITYERPNVATVYPSLTPSRSEQDQALAITTLDPTVGVSGAVDALAMRTATPSPSPAHTSEAVAVSVPISTETTTPILELFTPIPTPPGTSINSPTVTSTPLDTPTIIPTSVPSPMPTNTSVPATVGGTQGGDWPMPTVIATYTPVATPTPTCQELISNGGFEEGQDGWDLPITHMQARIIDDAPERDNTALKLGIAVGESNIESYSTLRKRIAIPAADRTILRFDAWSSGGGRPNWMVVTLRIPSQADIRLVDSLNLGNEQWQTVEVDLTPWTNKSGEIFFEVYNTGVGSPLVYYIDNVSIQACPQ